MTTEIEGFLPDDAFFFSSDDDEYIPNEDLVIDGFLPDDAFFFDEDKPEDEDDKFYKKHHYHHNDKYTCFDEMYDFFLAGITDDMFMELTLEDTHELLEEIMLAAIPYFEFPRHDLFDLDMHKKRFNFRLTVEEMMILRQYMIAQWIGYQLATIDLIKQKYSGSDFKFTSQASHIKQLQTMKKEYETQGFHLQRLYSRRARNKDFSIITTMPKLVGRKI